MSALEDALMCQHVRSIVTNSLGLLAKCTELPSRGGPGILSALSWLEKRWCLLNKFYSSSSALTQRPELLGMILLGKLQQHSSRRVAGKHLMSQLQGRGAGLLGSHHLKP